MSKKSLFAIIILSILYVVIAFQVSSLFDIKEWQFNFTKDNFSVFGALIALYTAIFNSVKFIYRNILYTPLSASCNVTYSGDDEYSFETSFINNTKEDMYIKIANIRGFNIQFDEITLKSKENHLYTFIGIRDHELKINKSLCNKHSIFFQYKDATQIDKYKTRKIKINIPCIEKELCQ